MTVSDPLADLFDWQGGLPCVAEWNVKGFDLTWHVAQAKQHRFVPSIFLPQSDEAADDKTFANYLGQHADALKWLDDTGCPVCLRMGNIGQVFYDQPQYRLPKTPDSIARSPLVWTKRGGVLDDQRQTDSFAPAGIWGIEGSILGRTPYVQALTDAIKVPEWVMLVENNEAGRDRPEWFFADEFAEKLSYKSIEASAALSVRATWYMPQLTPAGFIDEMAERRAAQYRAFYAGFWQEISRTWSVDSKTAAYYKPDLRYPTTTRGMVSCVGYLPELMRCDGASIDFYVALNQMHDFTSPDHLAISNMIPAWEWARENNPGYYRELSLALGDQAALQGSVEGRHLPISPELYGAYIHWLLWTIRDCKTPVMLRHWCASNARPDDLFFPAWSDGMRDRLGRSKRGDYIKPIMQAVDFVCDNPTLRKFFRDGNPVVVQGPLPTDSLLKAAGRAPYPVGEDNRRRHLVCNVNGPESEWKWNAGRQRFDGTVRVWPVATKLDSEYLLFAWTPCAGGIDCMVTIPDVGDVSIKTPDAFGYWLVSPTMAAKKLI